MGDYDLEKEIEARALEEGAKLAEQRGEFDLAAKFYRKSAAAYETSGWTANSSRCRAIAETIDD